MVEDWGHPCGKDLECTLHNLHCSYPNCYKGTIEKERNKMTTRVLVTNLGPGKVWIGTKNPTGNVEVYTDKFPTYPGNYKELCVYDSQQIVVKEDATIPS